MDLNADVGEGFGRWQLGDDAALLEVVSSANVACGFHAGDPSLLRRTCELAAARGVVVGAQVSYPDLMGFGRRFMDIDADDLTNAVLYQLGALDALARAAGTRVAYVKPHGALYNATVTHEAQAAAVVAAVALFQPATMVPPSVVAAAPAPPEPTPLPDPPVPAWPGFRFPGMAVPGWPFTGLPVPGAPESQRATGAAASEPAALPERRLPDRRLPVLGLPGSALLRLAEEAGLRGVREFFADRAYAPDTTLLPRSQPGAVLTDPVVVAERCARLLSSREVTAVDGSTFTLEADSICVHGDTADAAELARAVRVAVEEAGHTVRPFVS